MFTRNISFHAYRSRMASSPLVLAASVRSSAGSNRRTFAATTNSDSGSPNLVLKAGLPFVLFSVLASWVVSNALGGKLKEQEVSQGKTSISLRQAKLKEEHDEMMERLNKIVQADFDNTKRIKRPHEILEERRLERERRNKWYRRWWRNVKGYLGGSGGSSA